jgi:hypothetical protein
VKVDCPSLRKEHKNFKYLIYEWHLHPLW